MNKNFYNLPFVLAIIIINTSCASNETIRGGVKNSNSPSQQVTDVKYSYLNNVVLDRLKFENTPLVRALEYLRLEAFDDKQTPFYQVKIGYEYRYNPIKSDEKITLDLRNITLRDALTAICEKVKIKFHQGEDRLIFKDTE